MKNKFKTLKPLLDHSAVDYFLPPSIEQADSIEDVRMRLLVLAQALLVIGGGIFAVVFWFFTNSLLFTGVYLAALLILVGFLLTLKYFRSSFSLISHGVLGTGVLLIVWTALHTGGLTSPAIIWLVLFPLMGHLISGVKAALAWAVLGLLTIITIYIAHIQNIYVHQLIPDELQATNWVLSASLLLITVTVIYVFSQAVQGWLLSRLTKNSEQLRLVLETAPNGIISTDERGQVRNSNRAAEQMFGCDTGELTGRSIVELIPTIDTPARTDHSRRDTTNNTITGRRVDGEEFPLSVSTGESNVPGEHSRVMVLRDITEMREMRSQMMRLDRLSAVGTLASGVGHEINNPLSYIKGNLEFIQRRLQAHLTSIESQSTELTLSEKQEFEEMIDAIGDGLHGLGRIEHIVEDLRNLTRDRDEDLRAIDVEKCLASTLTIVKQEIEKRATLKQEIRTVPPVIATEPALGQVLLNLLLNAAQAIPADDSAADHQITVTVDDDDESVTIAISDTGRGISDEELARIFDPFFTTKQDEEGTGLGLTISQRIITNMNGRLTVNSEPGQGSTFSVILPTAPLDEDIIGDDRLSTAELPDLHNAKILIVDDDKRVCMALARTLERAFNVEFETDPVRALDHLTAHKRNFDALLVDLIMPTINGDEFIAKLVAKRPELSDRIIMMTGGTFTSRARKIVEDRGLALLEKPFEPALLFDTIEELIDSLEEATP